MGYHLTVLRTEEGEAIPITRAEFVAAVRAMPLLRLDDDESSARYIKEGGLRSTLTLSVGEVWTNNAEEDILVVMLELAGLLKARVRGDEGETYRSPTETYQHPDDFDEATEEFDREKEQKRRRMVNAVRLLVALVVIGLVIANALRK